MNEEKKKRLAGYYDDIADWEGSLKGKVKGKVVAYYWCGQPYYVEDLR